MSCLNIFILKSMKVKLLQRNNTRHIILYVNLYCYLRKPQTGTVNFLIHVLIMKLAKTAIPILFHIEQLAFV